MSIQRRNGLKGQKAHSPGHRPGVKTARENAPCKGKSVLVPKAYALQGVISQYAPIPKAMPWAMCFPPFQVGCSKLPSKVSPQKGLYCSIYVIDI